MKRRLFQNPSYLLIISSLFVGFFVLLLFILYVFNFSYFQKNEEVGSTKIIHNYQIRSIDAQSRRSLVGFITSFEYLGDYDYKFYRDENDNPILISNFGSNEFQCSGSCICEENENQRRNSAASRIIISGIRYLLVAMSSVVAYEISKEYFTNECRSRLDSTCENGIIKAVVDECDDINSSSNEKGISDVEEEDDEDDKYICRGACVPVNLGLTAKDYTLFGLDFFFDHDKYCDDMKLEAYVDINDVYDTNLVYQFEELSEVNIVRVYFILSHLDFFCRENSEKTRIKKVFRFEDEIDENENIDCDFGVCGLKIPFCVGHDPRKEFPNLVQFDYPYHSTHCIKTSVDEKKKKLYQRNNYK